MKPPKGWPIQIQKKKMPRWRVGRHLGRTVFVMDGDLSNDDDTLVGIMDTQDLARFVCHCVNEHYDQGEAVTGYWVISDEALLRMLHQVSDGQDPDFVFAEYYANSDHEVTG